MPLERKILLSILSLLIILFSSYFLYTTYYVEYKNNSSKIVKYKKLISGFKLEKSSVDKTDLDKLQNREILLKDYFVVKNSITDLTSHHKYLLLQSGLTISGFNLGEKSVRFSFTGTIKEMELYLYNLSHEPLSTTTPTFSVRVLEDTISGIIEITKNITPTEFKKNYLKTDLRTLERFKGYRTNLLSNFGLDLNPPKVKEVILTKEIEMEEPKVKNLETDKFSFVGILKKDNNIITMFKEKNNGRIYRFVNGETISQWTFIGKELDKYIFEKDGIKYEVKG